jgi:tetratricopeptide (TPR) repeat protein
MTRRDQRSGATSAPSEFFGATVVLFAALFVYTWTLAPTVTLIDSGELIVVAHSLGVAHPPGFPLWVMLAHLISLFPFGNIAARINSSSALFAALACAILTLIVAELSVAASTLSDSRQRGRGNIARLQKAASRNKTGAAAFSDRLLVLAPALTAGLVMAFSKTLWSYATVTEVYALNTLLLFIIFFLMLRWRYRTMAWKAIAPSGSTRPKASGTSQDSLLLVAAFLFGLALGVHHVTIALTLPALGWIVYRTEGWAFFKSRRLVFAALVSGAAFVAVYLYLPLAASRAPLINWGNPHSGQAIWWHITGRQYQGFLSFAPSIVAQQFVTFVKILSREFGFPWMPAGLALALAGLASSFKRERTIFWFIVLIVVSNLAYTLSYEIAEDKDAYCLPIFAAFAIAAGIGVREFIQFLLSRSLRPPQILLGAAAAMLLTVSLTLAANWPYNNRRHYFIAEDYVGNILETIKPNGLLLTLDWQVASPFFYVQEIEARRRDVKVLDVNLLRRSWYFGYLRQTHPDLIERSQDKIDAYVAELKQWEDNPAAYANNARLTSRIASKFVEMIESCVQREGEIAPVYITHDLVTSADRDGALTAWFTTNYALVPEGLVFRLESDGTRFHDPGEIQWQTRGLNDGNLKFESDDVVKTKVLPAYTSMLINRGRYFGLFNEQERAITAYQEALALDPNLDLARKGLNEILARSPKR